VLAVDGYLSSGRSSASSSGELLVSQSVDSADSTVPYDDLVTIGTLGKLTCWTFVVQTHEEFVN